MLFANEDDEWREWRWPPEISAQFVNTAAKFNMFISIEKIQSILIYTQKINKIQGDK